MMVGFGELPVTIFGIQKRKRLDSTWLTQVPLRHMS